MHFFTLISNVLGWEYSNYFLTGCAGRGLKPLPISKDFSPLKKVADLTFSKFYKSVPISLRAFLPQKWLILLFPPIFCEIGPSSKDFFDQNGTHV